MKQKIKICLLGGDVLEGESVYSLEKLADKIADTKWIATDNYLIRTEHIKYISFIDEYKFIDEYEASEKKVGGNIYIDDVGNIEFHGQLTNKGEE